MFFIKNFKFTIERGLELVNKTELDSYIEGKIQHFSKYENYSDKEEKLKLLDEIVQMCDHDKNTAVFDYSNLPTIEGFNISDNEEQMIYFFNLTYILGGIFLNVFDKEKNRIAHIEDGVSAAINTASMFKRAYNELIMCKNNGLIPAYGATLIFATLFEKDIKSHVKSVYVKQHLVTLKNKISAGNATLTPTENDLLDFLQYQYEIIPQRTTSTVYDGITATTTMLYDLLVKYNIISPNDAEMKNLICNKLTLNQLFRSQLFANITDVRFLNFVTMLFGTTNVNLRNDLAHCNFDYKNYYSIHIAALLFVLFTMVSNESFLV